MVRATFGLWPETPKTSSGVDATPDGHGAGGLSMDDEEKVDRLADLVANTVTGGAAAALALLASPEAAFLSASAQPAAALALRDGFVKVIGRRHQKAAETLQRSATRVGLKPAEVIDRLTATDDGMKLLSSAMTAAQDAESQGHLNALAEALASGAIDSATIGRESLFIRAVADLDAVHVRVLRVFTRTSNQLGLGDGSEEFDEEVSTLNGVQLSKFAAPDLVDVLSPILATLTRHGLVTNLSGGGPTTYDGMSEPRAIDTYAITDFGRTCLARLAKRD